MPKTIYFQPFSKYDFIESFVKKGGNKAQAEIIAEAIKNNQQNNIENLAGKEDILRLEQNILRLEQNTKENILRLEENILRLEQNSKKDLLELEQRLQKELKAMQLHNDEKFKMMELRMTIKLGAITTAIVGFFSILPNIFS